MPRLALSFSGIKILTSVSTPGRPRHLLAQPSTCFLQSLPRTNGMYSRSTQKTAFLTGELSDRAKSLYMKVPADLHQMLNLPPGSVFKLLKSVYGLAEAPIAWYKYLKAALEAIGWWAHPFDECMMMLYDSKGELQGIIGSHVDDLIICGKGQVFDKAMKTLESRLNFGTRKYHDFTYFGLQVEQDKKTKQTRLHQKPTSRTSSR